MEENRGAVKLFGKTISMPAKVEIPVITGDEGGGGGGGGNGGGGGGENDKDLLKHTATRTETEEKDQEAPNSEKGEPAATSPTSTEDHTKSTLTDQEMTTPTKTSNQQLDEEQNDTSNSQEKTLKRPDKILPCPRCNSMDTKFCYYNNYNVNQPRHFCKKCQRYWTAGGTMRNVPVGAGRRKNKHSANHYRHIAVSDATLPEAVVHHPVLKPNGTVLSFGSDMPLCESMASVLNLAEKSARNGLHPVEAEIGEEHSSGSSVTGSNCTEDGGGTTTLQEPILQNAQGYPPQVAWPYPWSPSPAFFGTGCPIPFYPTTAYWGCAVPVDWSIPWLTPLSSPMSTGSSGYGANSPTLGKHPRDGNVLQQSNSEKGDDAPRQTKEERCLWMPKTLRIDDPEEAAKSSIWATLGIKNGKADMISGGGLFKAFHPMAEIKNHVAEASPALHANPAALSRSLNFQESS